MTTFKRQRLTKRPLVQVKVLVNCSCREQVSNACDIGAPRSQLMSSFPHLDFSLVLNEVWWYRDEVAISNVTGENYRAEWLIRSYEEPECTYTIYSIYLQQYLEDF
jgi:hypothetical protein